MNERQLVEQGTHDELTTSGGVYSGLFQIQNEGPRANLPTSGEPTPEGTGL